MATVLKLDGVKGDFVVGLSWRHEDAPPKAKTLRELAAEKGRWGVVRETSAGAFQAGFCAPLEGVRSAARLRALAAVVADHKPQPWRGVYEIGEGRYWYIAVRDGQGILPDGDCVGTLAEVEEWHDRDLAYGGWSEVEGTLADLAEIMRGGVRAPALRDLQHRAWVTPAVAAAGLAVVGGASGMAWHWHELKVEQQRQAALARERAIAAALSAKRGAQARVLPWTQQPLPSQAFAACESAWSAQPLAVAGWTLAGWTCHVQGLAGVAIQATWARAGGVAADAPGMLSADAQQSTSTASVPVSLAPSSPRALVATVAQRATWTLAERNGLALQLQPPPAPRPALPGAKPAKDAPPPDPWTAQPVLVSSEAPFWNALGEGFDQVAGLRVSEVSWTAPGPWKATGTLYALRPGVVAAAGGRK